VAVNSSRSQRTSLLEGTTDGKYHKNRPDTATVPMTGDEQTMYDRSHLSQGEPFSYYGNVTQEIPLGQRAIPGA
jgi:hypothetical protein